MEPDDGLRSHGERPLACTDPGQGPVGRELAQTSQEAVENLAGLSCLRNVAVPA